MRFGGAFVLCVFGARQLVYAAERRMPDENAAPRPVEPLLEKPRAEGPTDTGQIAAIELRINETDAFEHDKQNMETEDNLDGRARRLMERATTEAMNRTASSTSMEITTTTVTVSTTTVENGTMKTVATASAPVQKTAKKPEQHRISARCRFAQDKKRQVYRVFVDTRGAALPGFCAHLEALVRRHATDGAGRPVRRQDVALRRCDADGQDDLSGARGTVASLTLGRWPGKGSANAWNRQSVTKATLAAVEMARPGTKVDWLEEIGCYPGRGFPPRIDY
ncbi:hypothetical protein HJFPF1_02532 [Paramyrothecium foliicola]|nr:hypothetical protein HJFPF1_02532 [Paramyrothecium foliicola]